MADEESPSRISRLVGWFDGRLGISHPFLRPVPQFSINPFYWLGALTVIAFVIQGVTGVIMMLYYVPDPTQAYTSTQYVFSSVYFGTFLETIHLYTAYAMIMLAFMHMMRGYFVSVHKKPRELMWVVGMGMGFVTLGFGFTGYLLPWTVISKPATDVGVGMIQALPAPLSSMISFLLVGTGGDTATLLRFYDLHVVVLPAVLLVLLTAKMYMLETHGISGPAFGEPSAEERKTVPLFPDVTVYLLELAALFGAGMLLVAVLFPLNIAAPYSPQAASAIAAQPDWYFLWIYQILKIKAFEGNNLPIALTLITAIMVGLVVLPFLDRSNKTRIAERPWFVTLGAIFIAEIAVLAGWGLVTAGQIISNANAVLVLGGTAALVAVAVLGVYRLVGRARGLKAGTTHVSPQVRLAAATIGVISLGAASIGISIDSLSELGLGGALAVWLPRLLVSLAGIGAATCLTVYLVYRLHSQGEMKRRIAFLDRGMSR
jgi:ubiquinol-cytochrome c reductase cytochrome b subunit